MPQNPLLLYVGACQGRAENNTQESHSKLVSPGFTLVSIARHCFQPQASNVMEFVSLEVVGTSEHRDRLQVSYAQIEFSKKKKFHSCDIDINFSVLMKISLQV